MKREREWKTKIMAQRRATNNPDKKYSTQRIGNKVFGFYNIYKRWDLSWVTVQKIFSILYGYLLEQANKHPTFTPCLILLLRDDALHCTVLIWHLTGVKTGTTVLCWKRSSLDLSLVLIRLLSSKHRLACQSHTNTCMHAAQGALHFLLFLWW